MSKPSVAIIGTNGVLGKPTINAFESSLFADKFQFPIKALSRSQKSSTDKVDYIQGSLNDVTKIVEAFKDVDVIIALSGPETFDLIEPIVKQVRPKLYIPSQFGTEIDKSAKFFPGLLKIKQDHSEAIRNEGIKVVDIITSLFAQPSGFLYEIVGQVGIDVNTSTVNYRGDPDIKFAYTTANDVGKTIAAVSFRNPSGLPDKVRVQSGKLSPREVAKRYEEEHNLKLESHSESAQSALREAQVKYAKGFQPSDFLYYLSILVYQGDDSGLAFSENENELINPGSKLWTWEEY